MSNEKIIGCFYLKKTNSGNILSEFTNNFNDEIFTESADLKKTKCKNDFAGEYITTWQEKNKPILMSLIIEKEKAEKYVLKWSNENGIVFFGQGFINGNKMIGYYTEK